jgi:hypothetical protein
VLERGQKREDSYNWCWRQKSRLLYALTLGGLKIDCPLLLSFLDRKEYGASYFSSSAERLSLATLGIKNQLVLEEITLQKN